MAEDDTAAGTTTLKLHDGTLTFAASPSEMVSIPHNCLQRSKRLQDLYKTTQGAAEAEVPVSPAALQLWLRVCKKHASGGNRDEDPPAATDAASSRLISRRENRDSDKSDNLCSDLSIKETCLLLMAAYVLTDDHTKAACTQAISSAMLQHSPDVDPAVNQAVEDLPEHLQLAILSITPLARCLSHLPPSWHPLALRTHHPSIDAHAALAFHRLPIASVHTALSAAATLTTLRALSLAGLTLPMDCTPCVQLLAALPALTALNLHDIGLRQASADAVAAVLPELKHLNSLDLSSNYITQAVMQALAPALRQCTALRVLDLWQTLSLSGTDGNGLEALACAMQPMQLLTTLSLGVFTNRPVAAPSVPPTRTECEGLMTALLQLPEVVDLRLDLFSCDDDNHHAPALLSTLAKLSQLQRLHCSVPPTQAGHVIPFSRTANSLLTSLHVDFIPETCGAIAGISAQLSQLTSLPELQKLSLRLPIATVSEFDVDPCTTLAEVLHCMTQLSHLQLQTGRVSSAGETLVRVSVLSVVEAVEAALALPQLRALHVPVVAVERGYAPLLAALMRPQHLQLSIDLYVRGVAAFETPGALAFAPLLPYVDFLDVGSLNARDESWLGPLLDEASALGRLRELRVGALLGRAATGPSAAITLLNSVSCLGRLEHLEVTCTRDIIAWHRGLARGEEVGGFLQGLRTLTGLTHLEFGLQYMSSSFQEGLLRACTCLPCLQVLDLGLFDDWELEVCGEVLPQLPLRVLHVYNYPKPAAAADEGGRGGGGVPGQTKALVFRQLEHLRCLVSSHGSGANCDHSAIRHATEQLPAFQMHGMSERGHADSWLYWRARRGGEYT